MTDAAKILLFVLIWSLVIADRIWSDDHTTADLITVLVAPAPRRVLATDSTARATLANEIDAAATEYQIDPAVLTFLAFWESSFDESATGGIGERGILQLHGYAESSCPHDMTTRAGQLQCGARWYRYCLEHCGTERGALTAYASGRCVAATDATRRKINYRTERLKEWRE